VEKTKNYYRTRFSPEVIREAVEVFDDVVGISDKENISLRMHVQLADEEWGHDSESEFFSDYRKQHSTSYYRKSILSKANLIVHVFDEDANYLTKVAVQADERPKIEAVFEVFEIHKEESAIASPPPPVPSPPRKPTIFIGHGRSPLWRDLKDHLHDKHGYEVEAYEVGARAGHVIRDILEDMMRKSAIALLVLTGEDMTNKGEVRARQNVIHETGLFQGKLGFNRAIVLLEAGVEEFSNIQGIQQIRFSEGNIKETFGEVLATLRREFSASAE
jgi:predicted nucleotide-binding protein